MHEFLDETVQTDFDVAFINPAHHGVDYYTPIGIESLRCLLENKGFRATIIDFQRKITTQAMPWPEEFFAASLAEIESVKAKVYAFTVMNVGMPWAVRLAEQVRITHKYSKIIFGGPHATILGARLIESYPQIDVVVLGEGEKLIFPLVEALVEDDANRLANIPNIIYRTKEAPVVTTVRQTLASDMDELPLLQLDKELLKNAEILSVEAGRGCPYYCSFCSSHAVWSRKPRFKSPKRLVDEATHYIERAENRDEELLISFEHDDFLANRPWFRLFSNIMIERSIPFRYAITARINHIIPEVCHRLSESGCVSVFVGLESGSQQIQKNSSKHLKLTEVLPRVAGLLDRGIHVSANFIVGFPDETMDDLYSSFDMMLAITRLGGGINISVMCPEPGSMIYKLTPRERYFLLENTVYADELRRGGIEPASLPDAEKYHLFTIENDTFDIREIAMLARSMQALMTAFPVFMFLLWNELGRVTKKVVDSVLNYQRITDTSVTQENAIDCLIAVTPTEGSKELLELLLYEGAYRSSRRGDEIAIPSLALSTGTLDKFALARKLMTQDASYQNSSENVA